MKERDTSLDIMRFLGVLIIMVAHSHPPEWLNQLRNFGTPLLIVASALTISAIYKKRVINVKNFYRKRILRLTVPPWIFLTIFFSAVYVVSIVLNRAYPFNFREILESYSFYEGIGYVWILKVYLALAFITPFALRFKSYINSAGRYFFLLLICYVTYEILAFAANRFVSGDMIAFLNEVVFVIIPYTLLFLYGIRLDELKSSRILLVALLSLGIFIYLAVGRFNEAGHFVQTQIDKYPPRLYYLSYSFFCLNAAYLLCKKFLVKFIPTGPIIWLSSNSLWIYLWHIMAVYMWEFTTDIEMGKLWPSLVNSMFILSFGVVMTATQNYLVKRFFISSKKTALKNLAVVLT